MRVGLCDLGRHGSTPKASDEKSGAVMDHLSNLAAQLDRGALGEREPVVSDLTVDVELDPSRTETSWKARSESDRAGRREG